MDQPVLMGSPEPVIVIPKEEHKQTFILLHGRGDRADSFGAGLLVTPLPSGLTLRSTFPFAKFVFLQAPLRELSAFPGNHFYQWFDLKNLSLGSEESDLQVPGLQETVELVHSTLRQEIELVGANNVILGGLSQGCASSLISMLLWDGPAFAACIGMSGWLPFRRLMNDALLASESPGSDGAMEVQRQYDSIAALARKLNFSSTLPSSSAYRDIPTFIGHGDADEVVVPQLGAEASDCLRNLNIRVTYKEYRELDHWYSDEMLEDIINFIKAEATWISG